MGHTFPGACAPFGAVQLSPDTDTIPHNVDRHYQADVYAYCAGYRYDDPTLWASVTLTSVARAIATWAISC